jgi:hypothetical protein
MSEDNKQNILYFERPTMRSLFECMENWQNTEGKRFLSASIHKDGDLFCCIALTNPMEVVICSGGQTYHAFVSSGRLLVSSNK